MPKASTELRPKQKRPVMDRDQRLGGDGQGGVVGPGAGDVLPQHDNRQEADEADDDERGLHDPKGDIAERDRFALPPEDREQHNGGGDVGDREQDFQERAYGHLRVGTTAEDVVGVAEHGVVEQRGRDREDEGSDEPQPRDERGPSVLRYNKGR
jgi:hypothetical protein